MTLIFSKLKCSKLILLVLSSIIFIHVSWFDSVEGTMQPALCPVGHYCPPGLTLGWEFSCPPGTVQSQPGASSPKACLLCPAGMKLINFSLKIILFVPSAEYIWKTFSFAFWFRWHILQGCSALTLVCPGQRDSARQDFTVLLDQPVLTALPIRCCSPSLLAVVIFYSALWFTGHKS